MIKIILIDDTSAKDVSVLSQADKKRFEVQRDINSYPINIDRNIFQKTKEEKEQVKLAKIRFKNK